MTTTADIRTTLDHVFEPALAYAEAPPARRRMDDLVASLQLPVDLAASGFICKVAPHEPEGFAVTVTLPPCIDLPVITGTGRGSTWCDALVEVAYALNARLDRVERDQQRAAELQEAA